MLSRSPFIDLSNFQEDKEAMISPELSGDKRAAGNTAFQKKKDEQALNLYSEAAMASLVTTEEGRKDAALALANSLATQPTSCTRWWTGKPSAWQPLAGLRRLGLATTG